MRQASPLVLPAAGRTTALAFLALLTLAGCVADGGGSATRPVTAPAGPCPQQWAGPGLGRCLATFAYGPARGDTLVVVLHGDLSGGGPADYHRTLAQRIAETLPGAAVVAMVRPGYPDAAGRVSDGDLNGRADHYTAANMALVAEAITALKQRTGARRVIAVGHSGGAATVANVLARHPGTVDSAVLLACPCALNAWRLGRRPWGSSVDPYAGIAAVPVATRLLAFTGANDDNTGPRLAADYVAALAGRGVPARFVAVPGAGHNDVVQKAWDHGMAEALRGMAGA